MRKCITIVAGALLCAMVAAAQDLPRYETFLGYTYVRVNSATDVPAFSANGGSGQFAYNFNKWISGVVDVGAVHNGNINGFHLDSTLTNFLAGPRVAYRKSSRITPYIQVLFGGVYAATSTRIDLTDAIAVPPIFIPGAGNLVQATSARISTSQTAFAMTAGGGLDIKINKHVSFRPIGLDYYMTRLQNLRTFDDNNQHNLRYTTGFNFTLGAQ
ncbi:MAG TPA: outer membrane beta-barrel protein [Bryobacteraceae bacterium]|nr:outer membrane beta-barrel protein [Bryobacteraceae bacterium]